MLEIWQDSTPHLVMFETWPRESGFDFPATSQLRFCSLIGRLFGLVCLICYTVPQCSTHPIAVCSCPVCQSRSDSLRPCLPCSRLHHAVLLVIALFMWRHSAVPYRSAISAYRLRHVIGLPSSPTILVGFLVTSVVSFDVLLIIVVL
jgi:hypothetical protein